MNLMVVGHAFIAAYIQKKYAAMKQLDRNLQLRLVVPSRMRDRFHDRDHETHPAFTPKEVVALKPRLAGLQAHMTYVHNPFTLGKVLSEFQPDVIHIEEEPQALITLETIGLRTMVAPNAVVTLFTWDNLLRRRNFPFNSLKSGLRRYALARMRTVICGNHRAAELLREEGAFRGFSEVLPHSGLDVSDHQPGTEPQLRRELGLEASVVVGYVGRLVPEKGIRLLVDALRRLVDRPWKLLLVGSGPLEAEIREQWMQQFPGRIVLVPAVSYSEVPRFLRCADIFVLASMSTPTWQEQFGQTLAQAMMIGIPSIGSKSGAIPEVLGSSGLLIAEGNSGELEDALERLLISAEFRQRVGQACREHAMSNFTSEIVSVRYLTAFENARLGAKGSKGMAREAVAAPRT